MNTLYRSPVVLDHSWDRTSSYYLCPLPLKKILYYPLSLAFVEMKYKTILKSYVLFGCCDVTSKVGTKAAELKNLLENFLQEFGQNNNSDIQDSYQEAEKHLVKVRGSSSHS